MFCLDAVFIKLERNPDVKMLTFFGSSIFKYLYDMDTIMRYYGSILYCIQKDLKCFSFLQLDDRQKNHTPKI